MQRKMIRIGSIVFTLALMMLMVAGCAGGGASQQTELIPKLTLVGPAGPMSIPLAYMVENNKLADIAEETELVIWENPDQLRAIVGGGGEGHFLTLPSNSAAIFYNKGMEMQLLDISVWGILYVISTDSGIKSVEDLKGREVVVPYQGNMPDLLFSYLCQEAGIDTAEDLDIYYANSPQQAAQLMLAGEKNCAVLTEPLVTQVLLKGKKAGLSLYRSIDIQSEWGRVTGLGERIPIAGTIALPAILDNNNAIKRFMEEYTQAIKWQMDNPGEAGVLGSEIEQLGFEAKPVAESIKNTKWDFVQVKDCREDIETFFNALMDLDPAVIGGHLPDEGFYYKGIVLK